MIAKWFGDVDGETKQHCNNVAGLCVNLGRSMGLPEMDIRKVAMAAYLHDVGKAMVPTGVLLKPGKLDDIEMAVMRKHCHYGYQMLVGSVMNSVLDMILYHHENEDGSGYNGIKSREIPLGAKIIHIVDVWDALISDRCYRPAWNEEEVKIYMLEKTGEMFDRDVLTEFMKLSAR